MKKRVILKFILIIVVGILLMLSNDCKKDDNKQITCLLRSWTSYGGYSDWTVVPNTQCNYHCLQCGEMVTTDISYNGIGEMTRYIQYRWESCGDIINNRPDSPVLISPTNSSNTTTTVTLRWSCEDPDGNSLEYEVYFGQTNPPYNSYTTNTTSLSLDKLKNSTTYYWQVYATDCAGTSNYSSVSSFTTGIEIPTVITTGVGYITLDSFNGGGKITSDGGAAVTERGVCWSAEHYPSIADSKTIDGSGTGSFTSTFTGLSANTLYYVTAYATNSVGTGYGNTVSIKPFLGTVTDIDGNVYKTIGIGNQIWMAESLRTTKYRNGEAIPIVTDNSAWNALTTGAYCNYNNMNDLDTISKYGRLYNWFTVADSRNIAPEGWHVPTDAEWTTLENYLIANGYNYDGTLTGNKIAKSLASVTLWKSSTGSGDVGNTDYPAIRNKTGFTALPSGMREQNGSFYPERYYNTLWSATGLDAYRAWDRGVYYSSSDVFRNSYNKLVGCSVRCIKD
jgi:uncharacterized protein (TIGR02145 family)